VFIDLKGFIYMKVIIAGCAGRMGRALLRKAIAESNRGMCVLVGATTSPTSQYVGKDLNLIAGLEGKFGLKAVSDLRVIEQNTDAIINFSTPDYSCLIAEKCAKYGLIHVCGTTGFNEAELKVMEKSALKSPLLLAYNMSIGVTALADLVKQAAARFHPETYDARILELHHKNKVDSPSGTALMLHDKIWQGRIESGLPRQADELDELRKVSISSIRAGGATGDHSVIFTSDNEAITISHRAFNRDIFVDGAFKACYWLAGRAAGKIYTMTEVLSAD
jgi:4-hydroxy-tetrahydrodipicolinate reductase